MGFDPFDRVVAFEIGAMSVITGIPGHGKSTFMQFACHHLVKSENIRVGHFGFETHPHVLRDHLAKLNTGLFWCDMVAGQRESLMARLDQHWRLVHRVHDAGIGHHIGWLKEMIHTLAVRDQCKMIVIDPWNELEHMPEKGESMTQYINFALQQIRVWAERWDCHISVVAHPRKIGNDGKVYPPSGYDIAESAAFANKPSLGLTVFMDEGDDPHVKLRTWKVRDTNLYGFGKRTAEVEYDADKMVYRRRA
jgi:twinkle protein